MTAHPGRMALLTQAGDRRLDDAARLRHLKIALPAGFDQDKALALIRQSAEVRAAGDGYAAYQILVDLLANPPIRDEGAR